MHQKGLRTSNQSPQTPKLGMSRGWTGNEAGTDSGCFMSDVRGVKFWPHSFFPSDGTGEDKEPACGPQVGLHSTRGSSQTGGHRLGPSHRRCQSFAPRYCPTIVTVGPTTSFHVAPQTAPLPLPWILLITNGHPKQQPPR